MLAQIFLKVMDMSLVASVIIAAVFIVRIFLKRFPKFISYMLWSVVLFRLLCPFTLELEVPPILISNFGSEFYEDTSEKGNAPTEGFINEFAVSYTGSETGSVLEQGAILSAPSSSDGNIKAADISWQELFIKFGKYVWIFGIGILLWYWVVSAARIRKKVSVSIPYKENIYITDEVTSPFVMGILNPKIYLPEGLGEREQEYIILHEKLHVRRLDHVVKPVAFAALCLHWFNPLVWAAFILFCKDMEMSCDESVIKRLGETIKADYSVSLLNLSKRYPVLRWLPVEFGEGDTKGRIKNLAAIKKTKRSVLAVLVAGVIILIVCLAFTPKISIADTNDYKDAILADEKPEGLGTIKFSLDVTEYYHTRAGDPSNLYYIDQNNVLWGSGNNGYGQLGQGTRDNEFHSDMIKVAENVVDVDYSQKGFVIFLTGDHKLYGIGNAGCGALLQYEDFDWNRYVNENQYYVSEPCLLMENVKYARCGRDDVVCLTEDGAVWVWGTIYCVGNYFSHNEYFIEKPQKILESAVLVTGGWNNHAALLQDGTVWTWGYNGAGNCGVAGLGVVGEPKMVAEDVVMVWTDLAVSNYPEPGAEDIASAWAGSLKYNTDCDNIAELGDIYPRFLSNTVIQKADGSRWVCGENVGTTEKVVHGAEGDYSIIWSHEFYPCE